MSYYSVVSDRDDPLAARSKRSVDGFPATAERKATTGRLSLSLVRSDWMTRTSQTVSRGTTVSKYTRLLRIYMVGSPNPRQPLP